MNTREKVIVGLTVLVALGGGGYHFWNTWATTEIKPDREAAKVLAARAAKDRIDAEIQKLGLSPQQAGLLGFIAAPWAGDPFLVLEALDDARPEDAPTDRDWFVYSGYIAVGPVRIAIINDREHFVGEELDIPGYRVLRVDPGQVLIGRPDGESTLSIVYQGLSELP